MSFGIDIGVKKGNEKGNEWKLVINGIMSVPERQKHKYDGMDSENSKQHIRIIQKWINFKLDQWMNEWKANHFLISRKHEMKRLQKCVI